MAKQRQTQKLIDIHSEALKAFNKIESSVKDIRQQCVDDRRFAFVTGAQWEGRLGEQFEHKPKFEINKIQLSLIRIYNEYRNNRLTVNFIPKDGTENDQLADTANRLFRATEQDSNANEAYDNMFDETTAGGIGALRLRSAYEDEYDEENEHQKIVIEPIFDADRSVYFDLDAKKYDKSDAKFCFILSSHSHDAFIDEWGEDPASWPQDMTENLGFDWSTPDVVYVAEYYKVEETKEIVYTYKTIDGVEEKYRDADFENDKELEEQLEAVGTTLESERKVRTRKVHKYILSGNGVLEDSGNIAGKLIPVVPMYGKRMFIDNTERYMGHVRLAKDSQRVKNMQTSKLAEISALSSVEKPILLPEQIQGYETLWRDDNVKNYPYLLINPVKDINGQPMPAAPLAYTRVPQIPPAMGALLQLTDADMKEILGNQEAGEQIVPNSSGKAIELIQNRLDMQTFIYMSNMSKTVKRVGEVWLSMGQELYIEEGRKMKGIGSQDETSTIELMKPVANEETGEIEYQNDLSKAMFDIVVDVGPSSSSKRAATVKELTGMIGLSSDPETTQVLLGTALMNMEGEGIKDVREFMRQKMLRMGVVKPTEEESKKLAEELENQPPDPNTQFLQAAAQEAEAKAAKARADTILTVSQSEKTQADTEKTKVDTIETLSQIDANEQQRAIEATKVLGIFDTEAPNIPVVPQ